MKFHFLYFFILFNKAYSFQFKKFNFEKKIKTSKNVFISNKKINPRSLPILNSNKYRGDIINTVVFANWFVHESTLLYFYNISNHSIFESIIHILILIWQYVGLFIISHDLHHAENPDIYQQILGRLSLLFYGGFLLEDFSYNHTNHHKYPGIIDKDPDFDNKNAISWYFNFMRRYINFKQLIILITMGLTFNSILPDGNNLYIFWMFPSLLASIQLFFYGTYLVHKENGVIINSELPKKLITFTSYNFGNHKEHYTHPKTPWYDL